MGNVGKITKYLYYYRKEEFIMEKKMKITTIILLTGALLGYEIGTGFASGQESMQFFSGYGYGGILTAIISFVIMYFTFVAYAYAGKTRQLNSLSEIFGFYAGNYLGKLFGVFAWFFVLGCLLFMTSGFGSLLNQQWGIPVYIGAAIGAIATVITSLLGMNGIVNIIGRIGPVSITFVFLIGIASAFIFFPMIPDGIELIKSGAVTVNRAATNWLTAGISFGGCCILIASAFVAELAREYRDFKFKQFKLILFLSALLIPGVGLLMGMNHLGNIAASSGADIPNLLLAERFVGGLGLAFAIIIVLEIYSTTCPLMWTVVTQFIKDEKSMKYRAACVILGVAVWVVACFVPYATLLGTIMTWSGYSGGIVFAVVVVRYFIIKSNDKKAAAIETTTPQ